MAVSKTAMGFDPRPPLDPRRRLRPRRAPARLGVGLGRRAPGARGRARAAVARGGHGRHDGDERAGVVGLRARRARRPARAGGISDRVVAHVLRQLRGAAAAAARRRGGRARGRGALAARPRLVLQPRGHRPGDGDVGLGRRVPDLGLLGGGRARQARARRVPGGAAPPRRRARPRPPGRGLAQRHPRRARGRPSGHRRAQRASSRRAPRRSRPPTWSSAGSTSSRRRSWPADRAAGPSALVVAG